jgi:hypothetical protein
MVVEKASRVEQVGVWGVFCLDGGEEGGFKEEFLATGDEVVFWFAFPHVSQDLDVARDLFL